MADAAGIGGRSVSVATPTESTSQPVSNPTTTRPLTEEEKQKLVEQYLLAQELGNAPRIINPQTGRDYPYGATETAQNARQDFLNAEQTKFLKPVDTAQYGKDRGGIIARLNEIAVQQAVAKKKIELNPYQQAIIDSERVGKGVYAGDPLDIARSNYDRTLGNQIASLEAEKILLGAKIGDPEAIKRIQLNKYAVTQRDLSQQGVAGTTISGKQLHQPYEIFTPKQSLTTAEQQQVVGIDEQIATLQKRLQSGYTTDTGRRQRIAGYYGDGKPFYGNEADHWATGLADKIGQLNEQKKRIVNNVRPATIQEREYDTGLKPASLYSVLQSMKYILGLPQFGGKRGTAPVLKAQVQNVQKVQDERVRSEQNAVNRGKSIKSIQANSSLSAKEKAKQIQALDASKPVTNEQFEASRAGFAAQAVNLPSSVTTRSVQDFVDLGRRIRERLASV